MKKIILAAASIIAAFTTDAQNAADKNAIRSLCGCFEVEFKYAETFSADSSYKLAKPYTARGLELAELIEETPGKMMIQHLLVISDTMIIKHWREDWTFENRNLLAFDQQFVWKKVSYTTEQVKGRWSQSIWEVDDAPRYQGSATWIHADGKTYWENNTDAPLPRREYSVRSDYNVLNRNNRLQLTADGWMHEQDNKKIIRKPGQPDKMLVQEKGYNIYHRAADSKCAAARKWWQANSKEWVAVRKEWTDKINAAPAEVRL